RQWDALSLDCGNQRGKVRRCHSETRLEHRAKYHRKHIQRGDTTRGGNRGGRRCQTNDPTAFVEFYPASCPHRDVPRLTGKSALRRDPSGRGAVTGQEQVADIYGDVADFTESKIVRGDVRAPLDRQGIRVYRQCASLAICETRIRRVVSIGPMEVALRRESCKPSRQ